MDIGKKEFESKAVRFSITDEGKEIAHGYMYIIQNDFHSEPYALLEYFAVDEAYRGKGVGKTLVNDIIKTAKEKGCYKILMQSRYGRNDIHAFYEKLGFHDHGKNFRMNLAVTEAKSGGHGATCIGCAV